MGFLKNSLIVFLFVSASSFAKGAATEGSEYQHQTPDGTIELTPIFKFIKVDFDLKSGLAATKSEVSGKAFSFSTEYGVNEMLSLGATLTHTNQETEYTPSTVQGSEMNGLERPDFYVNARTAAGPGSLRYGAHLLLSLTKRKVDADGDSNLDTGGTDIVPFVGYEMYSGASSFGTRLTYTLLKSDEKETDSSTGTDVDSTEDGGEILVLGFFFEHDLQPTVLGASLEITATKESTSTDSSGGMTETSGITVMALTGYATFHPTPTVTIVPKLQYLKYTAFDSALVDSIDGFQGGVAARFAF